MCTVSPARSRLRSKMVWAMTGPAPYSAGSLKRQASMPSSQLECTKLMSSPVSAVMKSPSPSRRSAPSWEVSTSGSSNAHAGLSVEMDSSASMRAMPSASVRPFQRIFPSQSITATSAPAAGSAWSRVVTHTREDSRPCLKCTDRLVTSTAAGTYMGFGASSSALPRMALSISTM